MATTAHSDSTLAVLRVIRVRYSQLQDLTLGFLSEPVDDA